jgi:hypothetical protein
MFNGSANCVLRNWNVDEGIERLKKDRQVAFLDHFLVAIERPDTKPKHRQSHGQAFLIATSRPSDDRPGDRSFRRLNCIRIDNSCPREVWQDRIRVVRASVWSLLDRW